MVGSTKNSLEYRDFWSIASISRTEVTRTRIVVNDFGSLGIVGAGYIHKEQVELYSESHKELDLLATFAAMVKVA